MVDFYDKKASTERALQNYRLDYRGLTIKVKQDFGDDFFLIDGMPCNFGYVVCSGMVNAMPAATWFQTVKEAKRAIDILLDVNGDIQAFWDRLKNG